ncbi:hypothetical protein DIPPA_11132 [Diplonema papillatum]|nr:hypothetical protein DIPPA_11132 [Diplonema papillatum]
MAVWLVVLCCALGGVCACCSMMYCYARAQRKRTQAMMWETSRLKLLDSGTVTLLPEPLPFKIYHNHFIGGWLSLLRDGQRLAAYNVYVVKLHSVDDIFQGTRQPWCRTYKAAQLIFGDGHKHAMIRAATHTQHCTLYREKGVQRVTKGELQSPADLYGLVNHGRNRGEVIFFTYVIMPNGEWRFSWTGTGLLRDAVSKHCSHADVSEEVVFAGEFHLDGDTLILDNSSGTYSPDKDHFPLLVKLFNVNFPTLRVEAWAWDDAKLHTAIANCPSRRSTKMLKAVAAVLECLDPVVDDDSVRVDVDGASGINSSRDVPPSTPPPRRPGVPEGPAAGGYLIDQSSNTETSASTTHSAGTADFSSSTANVRAAVLRDKRNTATDWDVPSASGASLSFPLAPQHSGGVAAAPVKPVAIRPQTCYSPGTPSSVSFPNSARFSFASAYSPLTSSGRRPPALRNEL